MFARVDAALSVCGAHLDATGARGTEIEAILVGYLLTVIHAEFEQHVVQTVVARCRTSHDVRRSSFTEYAARRLVKKFAISDLTGTLNSFDRECKRRFSKEVMDTPHHVAYDNIEANRQLLAHSSGINMTFDELVRHYETSLPVLAAFSRALNS